MGSRPFENGNAASTLAAKPIDPSTARHDIVPEHLLFRQIVLDTSSRTSAAIPFYVLLWLAIASAGGLWKSAPMLVVLHVVGLLGLVVLRVFVQLWLRSASERWPDLANSVLCAAILANGLYWGCLTSASLVHDWGAPIWWGMLAMAYALATAGSSVMAINPVLRYSFPATVLLPIVYCLIVEFSDRNLRIVGAMPFLFVYSVLASEAARKDYRDALVARTTAELHALAFQKLSATDALTGVANRQAFDATLEREWAQAAEAGTTLSLLMIDLDHFKGVNDTYGHPFGDQCLRAAARALEHSIRRKTDTVFRYGGEEFVVLLTDTDADGAWMTANRCLESVRGLTLLHQEEQVALTCSIGFALQLVSDSSQSASLVQDADVALYRAKRSGRDRACFFEQQAA